MKLKNLNQDYLQGLIDAFIANYDQFNRPIPAEKYLSFSVELPEKRVYNDHESRTATKAAIKFSWIPESREVCVDGETNSYETRGESAEDYFTILAGERIVKLQKYIEEILDKVVEN